MQNEKPPENVSPRASLTESDAFHLLHEAANLFAFTFAFCFLHHLVQVHHYAVLGIMAAVLAIPVIGTMPLTAVTAHGIAFAAAIAGAAVHGLPAGQPQARRKRKNKRNQIRFVGAGYGCFYTGAWPFPVCPDRIQRRRRHRAFAGYRLAGASFLCSSMRVQYTSAQAEALVLLGIQAGRHEAGPADAAHGGPAVGHHTAAACVYLHARFGNGRANCQTKCNRN